MIERASLSQLLKFCTGLDGVPPMGLAEPIMIRFQRMQRNLVLPKADACFGVIQLPITHGTKECSFFSEKMDKGILFSLNYYGRM